MRQYISSLRYKAALRISDPTKVPSFLEKYMKTFEKNYDITQFDEPDRNDCRNIKEEVQKAYLYNKKYVFKILCWMDPEIILNSAGIIPDDCHDMYCYIMYKYLNDKRDSLIIQSIFTTCCASGLLNEVRFLTGLGANVKANNDETLIYAAGNGHLPIVQYLVEHGVNNKDALSWAAGHDHLPVVQYLIEHGADIHADDDYALKCAVSNNYLLVVQYLIEHDADIHANDDEALICAAENGPS